MPRTVTDTDLESAFAYAIEQARKDPRIFVATGVVDWRNNIGSGTNRIRKLYGVQTHHTGSEIGAARIVTYVRSLATGSIRPEIGKSLCNTATFRASHAWPGANGKPGIAVLNDNYANHSGLGDGRILDELGDGDIDDAGEFDPGSDSLYLNRYLWGDEAVGAYADEGQQLAFVIFYGHALAYLGLHVDLDLDGRFAPVVAHRETTGRKVDPARVSMPNLRAAFEAFWADRYGTLRPDLVRALQEWAGVTVDGIIGPVTREAVQRKLGVTADGIWGRITITALQTLVGATPDGVWGVETTRKLQEYLTAATTTTTTTEPPATTTTTTVPPLAVAPGLARIASVNLAQREDTADAAAAWLGGTLRASAYLLQECTHAMAVAIAKGLGWTDSAGRPCWRVDENRNAVVWDPRKWRDLRSKAVSLTETADDLGDRHYRSAMWVELEHRATGAVVWLGSSHLSNGDSAESAAARAAQARVLAAHLPEGRLALGIDRNSRGTSEPTRILAAAGLADLTVGASDLRTYPAGDTRTDGVQIDAIFGRGVELRSVRLVDPGTVTDHRAWVATLAIPADTL